MKEKICHICKLPLNEEGSSICSAVHSPQPECKCYLWSGSDGCPEEDTKVSPQPEEWESRFDSMFVTLPDDVAAIKHVENIKNFIRDEIRKAEERMLEKAIKALPPEFKRQSLGNKWNLGTGEMEHYWGQSEEAVQYYNDAIEHARINLEALKK